DKIMGDIGVQGTEMAQINGSQPAVAIDIHPAGVPQRKPSNHLQQNNMRAEYFKFGVPLHKAALRGDWPAAKKIIDEDQTLLTASITKGLQNVLHLAAGTHHVHFVAEVVELMNEEDLELQDDTGNTALVVAAAYGNVDIADIMVQKNPTLLSIRGGKGMAPLYFAASFGRSQMAFYLYRKTNESLKHEDRKSIFFTCINTGLYDLALQMFKDCKPLATDRDMNKKTALHLLAEMPSAFPNQRSRVWRAIFHLCFNYRWQRNSQQTEALVLVKSLWKHLLFNLGEEDLMELIRSPSELLFKAAKLGNFDFLAELINSYPDLIMEYDGENRTIIHFAVKHRHACIFNIIHEIGSIKDLIATYVDSQGNNILHLAAMLPPPDRLEIVSGAALQMQQELLWFEVVEKIVQPDFRKKKNKNGKTPEELFSEKHKQLLRQGELWMKSTANSCSIVSALITTVVFAAAFSVPGGNDDNGKPNYFRSTAFLVFVLSDGAALLFSTVSLLMFLSILTSRYAEQDFRRSLPCKLMIGLGSLFFSIMTMMIAFSFTFVIACHYGFTWVPFLISIFAIVPIVLFAILQFPLLFDTYYSTSFSRILSEPIRKLYD
ncbi:hypothetical protein UlMin_019259, partial [Ulmus minor]